MTVLISHFRGLVSCLLKPTMGQSYELGREEGDHLEGLH